MNDDSRQQRRQSLLAALPKYYSPLIHLCIPTILALLAVMYHLQYVTVFTYTYFLYAVCFIVFINGIEWCIHKWLFHTNIPGLYFFYKRHTKEHHSIYLQDDMALQSFVEVSLVMVPFRAILGISVIVTSIYYLFVFLDWPLIASLFVIVSLLYVISYEWLHLMYHLPISSKNRFLKHLAHHHTVHHDPRLMRSWNFNVTIPLWDFLLKTYYKQKNH